MLLEHTLEKLKELKFRGMIKALNDQLGSSDYQKMSFDDRLGHLIDQEHLDRENRRMQTRLRQAKFKLPASMENINYRHKRGLNKKMVLSLLSCRWIKDHRNLIITGPTGIGKSYLGSAFGHKACLEGYKTLYIRVPRFFSNLAVARGDGSYNKLLSSIAKVDLLILDDWGLHTLNDKERRDFLEVLEDRYNCRSTIITSQVPVKDWHALIGESTIADAILDRLVHNSYRIDLDGDSLRKLENSIKEEEKMTEL